MNAIVNKVIVDSRCKFNYATYFLEGLMLAGIKWEFSIDESFCGVTNSYADYTRGFCMLLELCDTQHIKVYIDNHDANDIYEVAYEWCDIYVKVNICDSYIRKKVLPIGPTCSLRIYSPVKLMLVFLRNMIKIASAHCYNPGVKNMIHDYLYTIIRRRPYSEYLERLQSRKNYCFALSTLWYDDVTDKETNSWRLIYTKICKRLFQNFEGGFYMIKGVEAEWPKYVSYAEKYKGLIYNGRIPLKEYLKKTKQSAVVFNTPSVKLCLGWKLSEYLMLGKAIISTNINNIMPGSFNNGEHYLLVSSEKEVEDAVNRICQDDSLRTKLEHNAKEYFDKYLAPDKMIMRVILCSQNLNLDVPVRVLDRPVV